MSFSMKNERRVAGKGEKKALKGEKIRRGKTKV